MLLFNRYEYNPQTDLIGKGGFSKVYKAWDKKLNRFLALKVYKTSELSERYSPIAEIQRVIELEHPNISRYIDIEEIEKEDSFGEVEKVQVCVMELLEGGNFENYYNRNKDIVIFRKLLIDVLRGLSYLHRNGIIHRDIKPDNILIKETIDGPVAKITDFGISKRSDSSTNSSSSALIVSIPYMAPEQLNAKKYGINERIHYNIDLWSLGVTVYEVLTGEVLFKNNIHDSSHQIMSNIISNALPEKITSLPSPFNEFVSRCVIKDAKERTKTAEELILILQNITAETKSNRTSLASESPKEIGIIKNSPLRHSQSGGVNVGAIIEDSFDKMIKMSREADLLQNKKATEELENEIEDDTRIITMKGVPEKDFEDTSTLLNENEENDDIKIILQPVDVIQVQPDYLLQAEEDVLLSESETKIIPGQIISENGKVNITVEPVITLMEQNQETNGTDLKASPKNEKEHTKLTLFNRYDYYPVIDLIGKGGFSRVYKAFDQKLNRWVALKIYKTSEFSDRYSAIAEIRRVINLDHSNICRYLDIEEIEKVNPFGETEKIQVCVMELLDSGNFAEYFNSCGKDLEVMKKLLRDVLHGLSYLHKNGIIHRDIKPANILIKKTVEGPVAKITDFGISKRSDSVNNNSSSALIVSIPYMAPEQLNTKKYGINEKISPNLDLWSLGVTIYEVITGRVLFKNNEQDSSEQIIANIMAQELPDKIKELTEPFRSIVTCCIIKNASERAQKAEELLVILNSTKTEVPDRFILPAEVLAKEGVRAAVAPGVVPKKPESDAAIPESTTGQVLKRKIRFAVDTPAVEKRAKKQISILKICIAAAIVLLLIALIFYFTISR